MTKYQVYCDIKMLASFRNRCNITGRTIPEIARNMYNAMLAQKSEPIRCYGTLCVLAGSREDALEVDCLLYKSLYKHLKINRNEQKKDVKPHICTRIECVPYCILPMFAHRCLEDWVVHDIFQRIKTIILGCPELIDTLEDLNEHRSALNILSFIAKECKDSDIIQYGLDTLLAMSGDPNTIYSAQAKVDSKLYELIFDELRRHDYSQIPSSKMKILTKASYPWLSDERSQQLGEDLRRLKGPASVEEAEETQEAEESDSLVESVDDSLATNRKPSVSRPWIKVISSSAYAGAASSDISDAPPSYNSIMRGSMSFPPTERPQRPQRPSIASQCGSHYSRHSTNQQSGAAPTGLISRCSIEPPTILETVLDIEDLDYIRQFDKTEAQDEQKNEKKKEENPHKQLLTGCTKGIIDEPYYEVVKKIH